MLEERFDHEVAIERCLMLLFNNLHKFPLKNRFSILEFLLAPAMFNRLFFHWSYNVRKVFHRLLLFQFEYFFVIKTSNIVGLPFDIEAYFDFDQAIKRSENEHSSEEISSSLSSGHKLMLSERE